MSSAEMDSYTPEVIGPDPHRTHSVLAKILVSLEVCPVCNTPMVPPLILARLFSHFSNSLDAQRARAGWHWESNLLSNAPGGYSRPHLCLDCAQAGQQTFVCAHCKQERKSNEVKVQQFGDPPEFLCHICYETVPAAKWDKLVDGLEESHRYDWG